MAEKANRAANAASGRRTCCNIANLSGRGPNEWKYWVMLTSNWHDRIGLGVEHSDNGVSHYALDPRYRFGGEWSESIFMPAHRLDHVVLRPTFWVDPAPLPPPTF